MHRIVNVPKKRLKIYANKTSFLNSLISFIVVLFSVVSNGFEKDKERG